MVKKKLQENDGNLALKTGRESALTIWHGVPAELYMCFVGVFLEVTQRVEVEFMQIHTEQIRFCFQLSLFNKSSSYQC